MATIVLKEAERPFKLGIILLDVIELLNKYQNQVDRLWLYDRFYMHLTKAIRYIYLRRAYGTLLLFSVRCASVKGMLKLSNSPTGAGHGPGS